jgi:hypothetical protein
MDYVDIKLASIFPQFLFGIWLQKVKKIKFSKNSKFSINYRHSLFTLFFRSISNKFVDWSRYNVVWIGVVLKLILGVD